MKSDNEIAAVYNLAPITDVAAKLGLEEKDILKFGEDKAKIRYEAIERGKANNPQGKLILVSAVSPTKAGIGKTTTTIGLADALNKMGEKACITLREPSLGPFLGVKGGATGGGYSQVVPNEDINLHFTGDFHAITTANNYISAVIDNYFHFNPTLGLDPRRVFSRRVMDLNDRSLRNITVGLGGRTNGFPRETGFDITPASEVMGVLCLSQTYEEFEEKLNNIVIGLTYDRKPFTVREFGIGPTLIKLLKTAFLPNLVQSMNGVPAIIHGGPFANIAHGCNSLIATQTAMSYSDWTITEAGFGSDLGAEKFFDIKCRFGDLKPSLSIIVATLASIRMHGGHDVRKIYESDMESLKKGLCNLDKHVENIRKFNIEPLVCINRFAGDTDEELKFLCDYVEKTHKCEVAVNEAYFRGAEGALDLAEKVIKVANEDKGEFKPLYDCDMPVKEKIKTIATEIYGAAEVVYSKEAERTLRLGKKLGYEKCPVCIAKAHQSFSDDPKAMGRPEGFTISVNSIVINCGTGFLVPITGEIIRMPGLPKKIALDR